MVGVSVSRCVCVTPTRSVASTETLLCLIDRERDVVACCVPCGVSCVPVCETRVCDKSQIRLEIDQKHDKTPDGTWDGRPAPGSARAATRGTLLHTHASHTLTRHAATEETYD